MSPQAPSSSSIAGLAVEPWLRAADDLGADEERQHVVAVLPLRLGDEHLQSVAEVPQRLGTVAVVDEAVEGGEEDGAVRHRPVGRIGMRLPVSLREPDALRAKAAFFSDPLTLGHGDRLGFRPPARRQIPQPLTALTADDGDLSVVVEREQHQPDHARAPPAVIALLALRAILEVAGEDRSVLLHRAEDVPLEGAVLGQEVVHPALALRPPGTAEVADPRAHERQVLDRIDERVPLEERALLPEQPVELDPVVAGPEPAEEDEVLRPLDGLDDVDLEKAEPAHGLEHAGRGPVERLRPYRDPPSLLEGHVHLTTSSSPIVRASRSSARSSASSSAPEERTPSSRWNARTTSRPSFRSDFRSARPTIRSPRRKGRT